MGKCLRNQLMQLSPLWHRRSWSGNSHAASVEHHRSRAPTEETEGEPDPEEEYLQAGLGAGTQLIPTQVSALTRYPGGSRDLEVY